MTVTVPLPISTVRVDANRSTSRFAGRAIRKIQEADGEEDFERLYRVLPDEARAAGESSAWTIAEAAKAAPMITGTTRPSITAAVRWEQVWTR